jgi:ABC-type oligopeptide transport system substrate-binding subunit/class 3 adenylate cyclase
MPREISQAPPPSGTVTFLFTDIEGSTDLLESLGDRYAELLSAHRRILRAAFQSHGGREVDTQGDAFFYSFSRATEAVAAAVEAQRALAAHTGPGGVDVRVRMGLHTGEPLVGDEGYVGMDVHRAARVAHAGHGGQVLLSQTTAPLVQGQLPEGVEIVDLGRHRLKDMKQPERISQLVIDGLRSEFPPLTTLAALPPEFIHEISRVRPPLFLEEGEVEEEPRAIFVGRERELKHLREDLEHALAGEGGLAFIEGGAGRGKTALLHEFARQAMEHSTDLLAAFGSCSAFAGGGDPYLPFREIMAMLSGDVEERWRAKALSRKHALRLWKCMPTVARELTAHGGGLVNVFVPGGPLLRRLNRALGAGTSWLERLGKLVESEGLGRKELDQRSLFEQCEAVLGNLAQEHPLLLVLDDLQWADSASVDLLFHLGRRLGGRRIMLLGAYRPEDVSSGRVHGKHPLGAALSEFKRMYGDVLIDIGRTSEQEDRDFVRGYLAQLPHHLSSTFEESLYQHTRGHALFTVEVLRNLQERGDLRRDPDLGWVESAALDWNVIPSRVEGVIEERVGRLDAGLKDMLRIASVEGSQFTAQVLLELMDMDASALSRQLHQELGRRHRLVQEDGFRDLDGHRLHEYRFRHELFQRYVYDSLGDFERTQLHGRVGDVLEKLYAGDTQIIAPQLARHFDLAGEREKAVRYLLIAGDRARMVYANREATQYYTQALEYLRDAGRREEVVQALMKLGLVHTADFNPEAAEEAYARAFGLMEEMPQDVTAPQGHQPAATLRMAVWEPVEWDPGRVRDDISSLMAVQLFQGLVEVTPDYNVLPAGAGRWEVSEGGRLYTFHLRPELRWSDGSSLTAHDFDFAWRRSLSGHGETPLSDLLSGVRTEGEPPQGAAGGDAIDTRCPDEHTLQVRLNRPSAYFPQLMALPWAFPAPKEAIEVQGRDWPDPSDLVCNGAYRIEDWSPGEGMLLSRNPHYVGRFPGNVGRVECTFIREFDQALDEYANGRFDAINMVPADAKVVAQARERFPEELELFPIPSTFYLTFLADRPPFEDPRVRKAFIHAVDREQLVRRASRRMYRPASGGFVPPGMPGHSAGIALEFDPGRARHLLRAAGYSSADQFPALTLMTLQPGGEVIVRFLSEAWREHLGVEVIHEDVEWGEFLRRRDQDPPYLSLSGWSADYPDPDSMLRLVFHSREGVNPPHWKDERFDALVEQAARVLEQSERIQLYREADRILVAERAVIMPIGYGHRRQLRKPWVRMPQAPHHMLRWKDVVVVRSGPDG